MYKLGCLCIRVFVRKFFTAFVIMTRILPVTSVRSAKLSQHMITSIINVIHVVMNMIDSVMNVIANNFITYSVEHGIL